MTQHPQRSSEPLHCRHPNQTFRDGHHRQNGLQREARSTEPDAKVLEEIYTHELLWRRPPGRVLFEHRYNRAITYCPMAPLPYCHITHRAIE
jgi:hypothetical protein